MSKEEIEALVDERVHAILKQERGRLSRIIDHFLQGTGEYAGAYRLMQAFKKWK
jgi:hypothetical protein